MAVMGAVLPARSGVPVGRRAGGPGRHAGSRELRKHGHGNDPPAVRRFPARRPQPPSFRFVAVPRGRDGPPLRRHLREDRSRERSTLT